MSFITTKDLHELKNRNEKITVLTAYDASFTKHLEQAGVEVILIGDSLGMVMQGHESTIPVTVDDMFLAGILPGRTETLALGIYSRIQLGDDAGALALCAASFALALAAMLIAESWLRRGTAR